MDTHFFLTGGTGLVGASLLPRILVAFPAATVTLLLRAATDEEAASRLRHIGGDLDERFPDRGMAARLDAVRGDVRAENLGLDPRATDMLLSRTTHIIHGAATIRFDHPLDEARAINRSGTQHMLALARRLADRSRLQRFLYIGTSSVSGQRGGIIYEHELEMGQQFFNTYEQSKAESERLVRDHFDRFPVTIVRPSIIIGDSRTGHTTTFQVIYIPLRLMERGMLDVVPGDPATTLDLVPVDWVNDATVEILRREGSAGEVFHLTAGPRRSTTLGTLVRLGLAYFNAHVPLPRQRAVRFVSREELDALRNTLPGRQALLLAQMDSLFPYIGVNRLFDTTNTDRILAESGIVFPRFEEYADRILAYCVTTNWGKNRRSDRERAQKGA